MQKDRNLSGCQVFHSTDLPPEWECVPLAGRIELAYGKALREEDRKPGDVDVYGSNGSVGVHNSALVKGSGILIGRKGTIGAVHFATRHFWAIDTVYYVIRKAGDDLRFLYYLLDYLPLVHLNAATGVPGLSRRDAYALRGAFPPPDEQVCIVHILDAVETALGRTRAAFDRAKDLDHALLHELLERGLKPSHGGGGRYPSHWTVKCVAEVAEVGSGVTLGKDVSGFKSVELPYVRVANVQDGYLDLSKMKTVRVRVDEVDSYRLEIGDVLMTEGGDLDKLGRGTIWEGRSRTVCIKTTFLEFVLIGSY